MEFPLKGQNVFDKKELVFDHGGRRSLAGLEAVTLHPFPPTFALDAPPSPPPHTHTSIYSLSLVGAGGVESGCEREWAESY